MHAYYILLCVSELAQWLESNFYQNLSLPSGDRAAHHWCSYQGLAVKLQLLDLILDKSPKPTAIRCQSTTVKVPLLTSPILAAEASMQESQRNCVH